MNKTALKNFAIAARLELLQRVMNRANLYGVNEETCKNHSMARSSGFQKLGGELLTREEATQRNALLARINGRGYRQVMEEAAYTWFNRFIALRYMQEHNRLPVSVSVLPEAPGALPSIVREAQNIDLPGVDMGEVLAMLDGNRTDELYKYLLIALCNALSEPLPQMFEPISDYTELLFPDGLLKADSVLGELARLDGDCWQEIQVIGWLYQYYISERHDEVVDINGGAIAKEDIPAATCLYTTDWVVRYMVEDSLGRLWQEGHHDDNLRMKWRYYMDEAQQEPAVAEQLAERRKSLAALQPEQIRLLDPCMGSGHILVYAFDVLMDVYRSMGYTDRDAVQSIMENNLYGLDIDDRAAQLAYFAVMMKACEYDRRFLRRGVQPHVCAIAESVKVEEAVLSCFGAEKALAKRLLDTFRDAKEYGSILHVDLTEAELDRLARSAEELKTSESATLTDMADSAAAAAAVEPLLEQARILARAYDVVVTNPPYLNKFSTNLKRYIQENYADYKADLFAVFMHRNFDFCKPNGYSAFMTPFVWMFIKSYEKLRGEIINNKSITTLIQMEYSAFEEATVPICCFVLRNSRLNYKGNYLRLSDFKGGMEVQNEKVLEAQENPTSKYRYTAQQENFKKIPGMPVAYWVSENAFKICENLKTFEDYATTRAGMITGNNNLFMRMWHEVDYNRFGLLMHSCEEAIRSNKKWFPYNKGGDYRKWYGNNDFVINWENNGFILRNFKDESGKIPAHAFNLEYIFKENVTWSSLSSYKFAARYTDYGFLYDASGSFADVKTENLYYTLAFLCSEVAMFYLSAMNPTLNFQKGNISTLPFIIDNERLGEITGITRTNVSISKADWDSFETSWDFKKHPLM